MIFMRRLRVHQKNKYINCVFINSLFYLYFISVFITFVGGFVHHKMSQHELCKDIWVSVLKSHHVPDVYRKPPAVVRMVKGKHPWHNFCKGFHVQLEVAFSNGPDVP